MSDNIMEKVNALGERLKIGGSEVGQKISAGMSSVSFKMKEFFNGPSQVDKVVEEATADTLDEPDWSTNLELCDMMNHDRINSIELIRAIKKRLMLKIPRVQYLSLVLLETIAKNCDKAFSEIAAERVLDEMVKMIDDPQTVINNRNKALIMIEAWGESSDELRYLPVYEETYKSLRSRGVRFPGRDSESLAPIFTPPRSTTAPEPNPSLAQQMHREVPVISFSAEQTKEAFDVARNSIELLTTVLSSSPHQDALQDDLTTTLVQQCHQSEHTVQRIIESSGDDEALLFEALSINDEIQKVLSKFGDMKANTIVPTVPPHAMIPVAAEPDETPREGKEDALIRKPSSSSGGTQVKNNDDEMDDLDEMIFGKKTDGTSETGHATKKESTKDDLINF
ncbi:Cytosolic sorting protein GGA2/TOM1 [Heracleum sosnowskyi]|uniref:Cytosolic sorting protein GGA2/TOM1 n=1 Tax=Heracleum sosnowskyi TaxID=360622 RepID=A0AAD8MB73_9APIA|nr:Cytosolic sorting protein GGA2/TOM1 [Heracleum sosnowskyi]